MFLRWSIPNFALMLLFMVYIDLSFKPIANDIAAISAFRYVRQHIFSSVLSSSGHSFLIFSGRPSGWGVKYLRLSIKNYVQFLL